MKKILLILLFLPMIGFGQNRISICDYDRLINPNGQYQHWNDMRRFEKYCNTDTVVFSYSNRIIDSFVVNNIGINNIEDNNWFNGIIYDNFNNGKVWWELEYDHGYASKYTQWLENGKQEFIINMVNWDKAEASGDLLTAIKYLNISSNKWEYNDQLVSPTYNKSRIISLQYGFYGGYRHIYYESKSIKKKTPLEIVVNDPIHPARFHYISNRKKKLIYGRTYTNDLLKVSMYKYNPYSEIELDSISLLRQTIVLENKHDSIFQLFSEKKLKKAYKQIENNRKVNPKVKNAITLMDKYNSELEIINSNISNVSIQLKSLRKYGFFLYKIDEQVYLDSTLNKFYFIENNREVPINKYYIMPKATSEIGELDNHQYFPDIDPEKQQNTFFYKDINLDSSTYTRSWYNENIFLEFQEDLSDDIKNGVQKSWHSNGQLRSQENYVNGQQHGKHEIWNENGELEFEGNYVNGQQHGKQERWNENGELEREENYLNGQKNGKQTWDDCEGNLEEGNYVNGKQHGKQRRYDYEGDLQQESNYVNGQMHGQHKSWYSNGQLKSEGNLINGKRHGKHKIWFSNGQLRGVLNYVNGQQHGKQESWNENRELERVENYLNGQKHGKQTWNDYGYLIEENYVNGVIVIEEDVESEDMIYEDTKVKTVSNNGTYTSGENRITINGSSWSSVVVIISDFGSQYNENQSDNGIVKGDDLYDDSGYVKIGSISSSSSKSITTTLGGNRITFFKKE
jgi:antitoxin component YwqK of YwqJK toxin-antitoxin module